MCMCMYVEFESIQFTVIPMSDCLSQTNSKNIIANIQWPNCGPFAKFNLFYTSMQSYFSLINAFLFQSVFCFSVLKFSLAVEP